MGDNCWPAVLRALHQCHEGTSQAMSFATAEVLLLPGTLIPIGFDGDSKATWISLLCWAATLHWSSNTHDRLELRCSASYKHMGTFKRALFIKQEPGPGLNSATSTSGIAMRRRAGLPWPFALRGQSQCHCAGNL